MPTEPEKMSVRAAEDAANTLWQLLQNHEARLAKLENPEPIPAPVTKGVVHRHTEGYPAALCGSSGHAFDLVSSRDGDVTCPTCIAKLNAAGTGEKTRGQILVGAVTDPPIVSMSVRSKNAVASLINAALAEQRERDAQVAEGGCFSATTEGDYAKGYNRAKIEVARRIRGCDRTEEKTKA